MKKINLILNLLLFNVISSISFGQIITTTSTTTPTACDGTALYSTWINSYSGTEWTYAWYKDSVQIAGQDSLITGLCPGVYQIYVDSSGIFNFSETLTIYNNCYFYFTVSTSVLSNDNGSCSGLISANVTGGTLPYTYLWSNSNTTNSISNLCAATYTLFVTESGGCVDSIETTILLDTIPGFNANLFVQDDLNSNCYGYATVSPSGGLAPYSVMWDDGSTSQDIFGLCDGVYSVSIIDSYGDSTNETFIIVDSSALFGNNIYSDSIAVQNLYGNLLTNCSLDYTNIDSASLSSAIYDSITQNLIVEWVIYAPNGSIIYLYDTLGLSGSAGVYTINVSVYCPVKSNAEYFKIQGDFYFTGNNNNLSVSDWDLNEIKVYPNPFDDFLTINNEKGIIKSFFIADLQGRIVVDKKKIESNIVEISNLSSLSKGNYLLHLFDANNEVKTLKIIK